LKSKAEIIKFLKDSFALGQTRRPRWTCKTCCKNPGNSKSSRFYRATFGVAHAYDHYGQLVEYLRMNGIVPPASRPKIRLNYRRPAAALSESAGFAQPRSSILRCDYFQ